MLMRQLRLLILLSVTFLIFSCKQQSANQLYSEGIAALNSESLKIAEKRLSSFVKDYPKDPRSDDALLILAQISKKKGQEKRAKEYAFQLLSKYPDSELAYEIRLLLLDLKGKDLLKADELKKIHDNLYTEAFKMTSDPNSLGKAERIFQALLARFPNDAKQDTMLFALAQTEQNMGRGVEAISRYEELLKKFPKSSMAYKAQFMIGFIYSENLLNYDKAREAYQKVIDNYPNSEVVESAKWMLANMGKKVEDLGIFKSQENK